MEKNVFSKFLDPFPQGSILHNIHPCQKYVLVASIVFMVINPIVYKNVFLFLGSTTSGNFYWIYHHLGWKSIYQPLSYPFRSIVIITFTLSHHLKTYWIFIKWGRNLFRFLIDHLENPDHHPRVMGCVTLTPKDNRLSNTQKTTNPIDCTTFVWEVLTVYDNELRLYMGQGITPTLNYL